MKPLFQAMLVVISSLTGFVQRIQSQVSGAAKLFLARVCGESIVLYKPLHAIPGVERGQVIRSLEYKVELEFQVSRLISEQGVQLRIHARSSVPISFPITARIKLPAGWMSDYARAFEIVVNSPIGDYHMPIRTLGPGQPVVRAINRAGHECSAG